MTTRARLLQRAIDATVELIESAPTPTVRDAATTHYRELCKLQVKTLTTDPEARDVRND